MTQFFEGILSFLGSIIAFVHNLGYALDQLFLMIPQSASMLTYSISLLPVPVFAFASAIIMISIAYLIIGR